MRSTSRAHRICTMKFYSFPPSPNVRKVNAVIAHLGISDIEHRIINLAKGEHRQPAFLAINPMGKLPALADDSGLLLWESNAICQFLCERQGNTPLYPRAREDRADTKAYRRGVRTGTGRLRSI